MLERRSIRAFAFVGLAVVLAVLFVDYSANLEASDPYPSEPELQSAYDDQVGESIHLWAVVTDVGEDRFTIRSDEDALTVRGSSTGIDEGDLVQVYGELRPNRVIDSERVVVSNAENRSYMFVVSGLGVVLTVGLFVREWTIDRETLALVPRRR